MEIAIISRHAGNPARAKSLCLAALRTYKRVLGDSHPQVWRLLAAAAASRISPHCSSRIIIRMAAHPPPTPPLAYAPARLVSQAAATSAVHVYFRWR